MRQTDQIWDRVQHDHSPSCTSTPSMQAHCPASPYLYQKTVLIRLQDVFIWYTLPFPESVRNSNVKLTTTCILNCIFTVK